MTFLFTHIANSTRRWKEDPTAGGKTFYTPSADYIWPHTLNKKVREVVADRGGEIVGEQYFPLDHTAYRQVVADIMASGAEVVFNTIVPPGLTPFLEQLHRAGFTRGGGTIVCTYSDENFLNLAPAEQARACTGASTTTATWTTRSASSSSTATKHATLGAPCSRRGARAPVRNGRSSSGRLLSPKQGRSTRTT